jgi:transposase-like protein
MGKERTKVNADRQRQRYNREFKLEAVRLLELGQKPAAQLALELGIRRNLLYKWQKEVAKDAANDGEIIRLGGTPNYYYRAAARGIRPCFWTLRGHRLAQSLLCYCRFSL